MRKDFFGEIAGIKARQHCATLIYLLDPWVGNDINNRIMRAEVYYICCRLCARYNLIGGDEFEMG